MFILMMYFIRHTRYSASLQYFLFPVIRAERNEGQIVAGVEIAG